MNENDRIWEAIVELQHEIDDINKKIEENSSNCRLENKE